MAKKTIQKAAEAPASAFEDGVERIKKFEQDLVSKEPLKTAEEYWHTLGPGLTTGASDDDPSGIATYSQTGARYGFQLSWLSLFTFPLMAVVQEMCARIGLVTGRGLAGNIRQHYSKKVLYACGLLLFVANVFNIGADLGAMAQGAQLLAPGLNFYALIIFFAGTSLVLQIFTTYARYARYLKYLALVLFAYMLSALSVQMDWHALFRATVIPSITFSKEQILLICAILGTTISPYLFFWQTSQEVEEEILRGEKTISERRNSVTSKQVKEMRVDVWSGMFVSNVVMFFIIAACAATLFVHGQTDIQSASDAALALKPFAGNLAYWFFAIGIIGTGLLAIPVLAGSASYALSESFGWKQGLYRTLGQAKAFYGVIIIAMVLGILLNFTQIDPIKALIYSAVLNGVIAPPILILIVRISGNRHIMGEHASGSTAKAVGWLTVALMTIAGAAALISLFV